MDVDVAHYLPDKLFLCRIIHHLSSFFFKNHLLRRDFLCLGELVTRGMTNPRENSSEALAQNLEAQKMAQAISAKFKSYDTNKDAWSGWLSQKTTGCQCAFDILIFVFLMVKPYNCYNWRTWIFVCRLWDFEGCSASSKDGYLDKKEIIAYSKKDLTWEGLEFVVWDGFFFSCCY